MNKEGNAKLFHDLKNDLASMTALLNLHKLYKNSISSEELLNRLYERQVVMALAYEKLYQENDYPYIGVPVFVNELLSRESRTLGLYQSSVKIIKTVDDFRLPIKKITPLAQVLVELVSNSYRHAFSGSDSGKLIEFSIIKTNDSVSLEYTDNGKGFPADFKPSKSRSLGMQFINSLSRQLGTLPVFNEPQPGRGMRCRINFSI